MGGAGSGAAGTGGGGAAGSGGGGATGSGGGGATGSGGGGAGACPSHLATSLPPKINDDDACPYVGMDTAGCAAGTFEYDCQDDGIYAPPEAGCTHPASGAATMTRWCCTSALCSRFFDRDTSCDCTSAEPNDYNCAPGATAAATCTVNASGDYCCPFTD